MGSINNWVFNESGNGFEMVLKCLFHCLPYHLIELFNQLKSFKTPISSMWYMIYENDALQQHQINFESILWNLWTMFTSDAKFTKWKSGKLLNLWFVYEPQTTDAFIWYLIISVKYKWHQSTWLLAFLV